MKASDNYLKVKLFFIFWFYGFILFYRKNPVKIDFGNSIHFAFVICMHFE